MAVVLRIITLVTVVICDLPWYISTENFLGYGPIKEVFKTKTTGMTCKHECLTTLDCTMGLSCFHATNENNGCCLLALKPNETGCVLDDQCKRACESTICDKSQKLTRCLCEKGRHFLFNKCWKKCPDFAHSDPVVDVMGFSRCELKTDIKTAVNYMKRMKRQMRSNFC